MQNIIDIIKDNAVRDTSVTGVLDLNHYRRLRHLTGINLSREYIKSIFIWDVDPSFATKFRYVAQIGDKISCVFKNNDTILSNSDMVLYQGDIPEFALDKMDVYRTMYKCCFTIHSNLPLPIQETSMEKSARIIISWYGELPIFRVNPDAFNLIIPIEKKAAKGLVIAAWDGDREIDLVSI